MSLYMYFYIYFICLNSICGVLSDQEIKHSNISKDLNQIDEISKLIDKNQQTTILAEADPVKQNVSIQLYYECMCPYSTQFYTERLIPVIQKLGQYLNVRTYPYGNAQTIKSRRGYRFKCQHGPEECYGNKLHACAIDLLQNKTQAIVFNSCLMMDTDTEGSDDETAEACGRAQHVDTSSIKQCAKGHKGVRLLKYYGDESKKVHFHGVPYLIINGIPSKRTNFMQKVCAAFTVRPPPCEET